MITNILAVDDNPMNLESTKELLESWGYRVDTAEKPSDALKMLQGPKEYSVLLLDYLMPEMDGAELAEKIRKTNDESVILMYSCEDSRDAIKESLRAQVMDFIDKDASNGTKVVTFRWNRAAIYQPRKFGFGATGQT
jgi:CheY-like chemotaxis protein